jgi:hypothetical protein
MHRIIASMSFALIATAAVAAELSPNLLPYGDFEAPEAVKTQTSGLTQEEWDAQAAPIPAWGFHPAFDLGRWIGSWGISTYDDPRQAWSQGGATPATLNRSTAAGGNRFLEGVSLHPWVGVFVAAPTNMVAGPAKLDFDFYFNYWDTVNIDTTWQKFQVVIHGLHADDLPQWQDRFLIENGDDWDNSEPPHGSPQANWTRIYSGAEFNSVLHGQDLVGDPQRPYLPSQGDQWHAYSDGWTEISPSGYVPGPGEGEDGLTLFYNGEFTIDDTYDYFYLTFRMTSYWFSHPYFWLHDGRPSDAMSVAIDNVSLQVSVGDPVPDPVPGDFSGDGEVNTADINPFILALTHQQAWIEAMQAILGEHLNDQQIIAYVDPNSDGVINTADIVPFINLLTGGGGAIIPEPSSLALLGVCAMVLARRRRRGRDSVQTSRLP